MIIIFFSFSSLKNLFIENQQKHLKDRIVINDIEIIFKGINPNVKIKRYGNSNF